MVDWASQDRLYPTGYRSIDTRYRTAGVDSSLPFSVSFTKKHSCHLQPRKSDNNQNNLTENLYNGVQKAVQFYENNFDNNNKNSKLVSTYISNIKWPRSVCCLSDNDGSIIVCEEDRCRLLLFSAHLIIRSTCGGKRGNGFYEFDSPWSVVEFVDNSISHILVADTNNQRIQLFTIQYDGQFLYDFTLLTKEKPFFITANKRHFAVSCQRGFIQTFSTSQRIQIANINLNKILPIQTNTKTTKMAYCLCMDRETSFLYVSNPIEATNIIYQLSITGEYLRLIKLDHRPFLHISSMTFDSRNGQIIIADSLNSIIYSVEPDISQDNVQILLKRFDNLNYPQGLSIANNGHLIVVECSLLTQHAIKIFRYHSCVCHSMIISSSVKTSETTSVRSIISQY